MNNQSNSGYDKELLWSENPDDIPSVKDDNCVGNPALNLKEDFVLDTSTEPIVDSDNDYDDGAKKGAFAGLIKTASMMILALALLIFVGIAWFTMNKGVSADGMGVKVGHMPFEIAAYGTSGTRYGEIISVVAPEYTSGTATTISGTTYYATGVDTNAIRLRYSAGESEIGPGGNGRLDLYIIPQIDGTQSIDIRLSVTPYATVAVYDLDPGGNKIPGSGAAYQTTDTLMPISEITTEKCDITAEKLATLNNAASYINGHVMFFKQEGYLSGSGTSDNYYYKEPVTDRIYTYTLPNDSEKGNAYYVPIYWMWPNTLGQILLNGDQGIRSGIPVVEDGNLTEKEMMANYLIANKSSIFSNAGSISDGDIVITPSIDKFTLMSNGYNEADFAIGSNVEYFLIELNVSSHEE